MEEKTIIDEFEDFEEDFEEVSRWGKFKSWISDNKGKIVDLFVAGITLAGACVYSAATKRGVDDYLYTETDDGIYRIPVKKMKSTKSQKDFVKKSI